MIFVFESTKISQNMEIEIEKKIHLASLTWLLNGHAFLQNRF